MYKELKSSFRCSVWKSSLVRFFSTIWKDWTKTIKDQSTSIWADMNALIWSMAQILSLSSKKIRRCIKEELAEEKCDVTYPSRISRSSPASVPAVRPCGIPFLDVSTTWPCCNWYMRKYNKKLWKCKNMILWTLKLSRNAANVCKQSTLPTVGEVGTRKSKQVKQSQYRLSTQLSD